jgi:hypothetical protein
MIITYGAIRYRYCTLLTNYKLGIQLQLEQFRENDIGTHSVWIPKLGNDSESMTPLTYPQFTHLAFYNSAQQIEQLEFSSSHIQQGTSVQTSVGLWFISIEAYINSILRIACLVTGKSFNKFKGNDLGSRITTLFEILDIDRKPFYAGSFQKLEEFKRYRNELFHDRINDKPLDFHKTSFSGNPMYANQVDVMQASVIALETYQAFRYVIPNIDLMPQIRVTKEDSFFHAATDNLYTEVLRPYFESVLLKHSLTSSVVLDIAVNTLAESQIFDSTEIHIGVKATQDEKFNFTPSKEETSLGRTIFEKMRSTVTFDTSKEFKIANYYRGRIPNPSDL